MCRPDGVTCAWIIPIVTFLLGLVHTVHGVVCGPMEVEANNNCINMHWCKYKKYMNPRTWADAKAICEQDGYRLAHLTDWAQHDYLTSFYQTNLPAMSPDPGDATAWVGLQQEGTGKVPLWHDDCVAQDVAYSPAAVQQGQGCFAFDRMASPYQVDDCTVSKQFICERPTFDINDCFESVDIVLSATLTGITQLSKAHQSECYGYCSAMNCAAFRYYPAPITVCVMMTQVSTSYQYTKGSEKYTKAVLFPAAVVIANTVTVNPVPCAGPAVPSTPVVMAMTSTTATESSSAVDPGSTTPVVESSSGIAPSSTLLTDATTSTPTPVLSSNPASVDLTTASLTTEPLTSTGTPISSCYHCYCNSNQLTSITPEELQSQIEVLKKELTVEKKDLSSWKRKLISAPDERTSARGLGYLGAGMLAFIFGAVLLIDLPRFFVGLKTFYHCVSGNHGVKVNTLD